MCLGLSKYFVLPLRSVNTLLGQYQAIQYTISLFHELEFGLFSEHRNKHRYQQYHAKKNHEKMMESMFSANKMNNAVSISTF